MRTKHVNAGFSHADLRGRNFSGNDYLECDFRHSDMTGVDLTNSNLFMSDFTGARLGNATISLNCFTFRDIKLDDDQVDQFLYLLTLADISDDKMEGIMAVIGEKKVKLLKKLLGAKRAL